MAKCISCGRKGIFLRLTNGLCNQCIAAKKSWSADPASERDNLQARQAEIIAYRQAEEDWLERHYDLKTVHGIMSIPNRADLPNMHSSEPRGGVIIHTGDVDYYLHMKASRLEDEGKIDLAIACLQKSNAIRWVTRLGYRKSDYYALVGILARAGRIEDAQREKNAIDAMFGDFDTDFNYAAAQRSAGHTLQFRQKDIAARKRYESEFIRVESERGICKREYKWLQENLPSICPKSYPAYMRMKKNYTKNFERLVFAAGDKGFTIFIDATAQYSMG